jgi:DNA polymerase-3 subunit gamma/tau
VEHSEVAEANGELQFLTPKEFSLAMDEKDIQKAIQQVAGRTMKIKITIGEPPVSTGLKSDRRLPEDDVSQRALAHPEVRRFQEMFPGAQVRAVRNLKE